MSQSENFVGLSFGAALPQGDFASKDFGLEGAGYATTGFLVGSDAALFPDEYLGIGASITFINGNIDKKKYKEDYIQNFYEKYEVDLNEQEDFYFDMEVWRVINMMVGPATTFNAGSVNFDFRALIGASFVFPPGTEIQFKYNNKDVNTYRQKKVSIGFGYCVGAGIRYAMKSGYVIRLTADYSGTKVNFDTNEDIINDNGNIETLTKTVAFPVNNIQLGIGIAYNFEI
jgi:hypothetical protein